MLFLVAEIEHESRMEAAKASPHPDFRLSAPPAHPLTICRRSDRRFSNFQFLGARGTRRVAGPEGLFNFPPQPAAWRAVRQRSLAVTPDNRRTAARRRADFDALACKLPSWRVPPAVPIPWRGLPSLARKLVSDLFRQDLEEAATLTPSRGR